MRKAVHVIYKQNCADQLLYLLQMISADDGHWLDDQMNTMPG